MYTVILQDSAGKTCSFKNVWAVQIEENYLCLVFSGYDMLFEKVPRFTVTYIDGVITIIGVNLQSI